MYQLFLLSTPFLQVSSCESSSLVCVPAFKLHARLARFALMERGCKKKKVARQAGKVKELSISDEGNNSPQSDPVN